MCPNINVVYKKISLFLATVKKYYHYCISFIYVKVCGCPATKRKVSIIHSRCNNQASPYTNIKYKLVRQSQRVQTGCSALTQKSWSFQPLPFTPIIFDHLLISTSHDKPLVKNQEKPANCQSLIFDEELLH